MSKIKRVIIEYEDEIKYLEAKDAASWIEKINNAFILQFIHFGATGLEKLKWKKAKKLILK